VERPELRTFTREDPVHVLKRKRGCYVTAALTVLHAYNDAGRPYPRQSLGGFEGWSGLVRDALLWLGEVDPVKTIEDARTADPDRQKLEAVIAQWRGVLGNRSVTTRAVIDEACWFDVTPTPTNSNHITYRHPEFRNALLDVANERGRVSVGRLGKWIGANKHKVVGKHRLEADTLSGGNARWRLQERQADGAWL
jgi:putative DNA primase/helicase